MLEQVLVFDLVVERQVYFVREQQVIQFVFYFQQFCQVQRRSRQGQINIGAGLVIAFCSGAVDNRSLDAWMLGKNLVNRLDGVWS